MTLALAPAPSTPRGVLPGTIRSVEPGSLATDLGIQPGDRLLSIDGHALRDVVDYRFYSAQERLTLEVERKGKRSMLTVEKDPDDPLGMDFGVALFDDIIRCNNNCYFCFIGGNRKEMRRSLFIKDDDFRLSFLYGNFATLTNLANEDWARIEEQRLSPLYVSVHATETALRRRLLANSKAPDILPQLDRLAGMGIRCHCQLVICPGINDGEHLVRSVEELGARYPCVQSISAVPVGLTELNLVRGAFKLKRPSLDEQVCNPDHARTMLAQIRPYQQRYLKAIETPLVYASDEYYLVAGKPLPPACHYGDYAQFENGVGMVRWLLEDWRRLKRRRTPPWRGTPFRHITLLSGTLIAPVLAPMARELAQLAGIRVDVVPVPNLTFGAAINCSGLLAGRDIFAALKQRDPGDLVVLPRYALDDEGVVFLDDVTPEEIERRVGRTVRYAKAFSDIFVEDPPSSF